MGTVYTEIKCQTPGCKTIDRIEGAFPERVPDTWGELAVKFGPLPEIKRVICSKCVRTLQLSGILAAKKKRSDAGKQHKKEKDTETSKKGQSSPKDKQGKGRKRKGKDSTTSGKNKPTEDLVTCIKCGSTVHKTEEHSESETPASAAKWREENHLPCPGCHIDQRKVCILVGIAALDCWNAKQVKP